MVECRISKPEVIGSNTAHDNFFLFYFGGYISNTYLLNLSKPSWYLEITYLVVELKECKKLKEVISKC